MVSCALLIPSGLLGEPVCPGDLDRGGPRRCGPRRRVILLQTATTAWSVVRGAQAGGEAARDYLERLIRTYWKPAYYYARRRGMDHHAASDAVQEFCSDAGWRLAGDG